MAPVRFLGIGKKEQAESQKPGAPRTHSQTVNVPGVGPLKVPGGNKKGIELRGD
jgi:hypothetical protein